MQKNNRSSQFTISQSIAGHLQKGLPRVIKTSFIPIQCEVAKDLLARTANTNNKAEFRIRMSPVAIQTAVQALKLEAEYLHCGRQNVPTEIPKTINRLSKAA